MTAEPPTPRRSDRRRPIESHARDGTRTDGGDRRVSVPVTTGADAGGRTTTDGDGDAHDAPTLVVSPTAAPDEAAAVAAAVGAHLEDRRRAAARARSRAASAVEGETAQSMDPWVLAGRYGLRDRSEVPDDVAPEDAWKMAGRLGGRRR